MIIPIEYVSAAAAIANLSGNCVANDMIVVYSYNAGVATVPTLVSGYTDIVNQGGTGQAFRLAYRLAVGGETNTGTWTNANNIVAMVYRGASGFGTTPAGNAGNSTTLTYTAVTLTVTDGSSIALAFGGASSATAGMNGHPGAGATFWNRTSQTKVNGCETQKTKANTTSQTLTVTTTGRWLTVTIELKATVDPVYAEYTGAGIV